MSFLQQHVNSIFCTQDDAVAVITFNRPDAMNALSHELEAEFHAALDAAQADPTVRSIVITGAGAAFSAGYDLGDEAELPDNASAMLRRWWDVDMQTPDLHWHVMRLEKPVIAAVNGWCLGGGLWYALCADITIASDKAVFGQPEVREIQNSSFLLPALVGWKHAARYALTGDHFDANEAARIGMINEVVPHDELMAHAMKLAHRLALVPPDSVRLNKAITAMGLEAMGLRSAMSMASALSVIVHASTDSPDVAELYRIRNEEGMRQSLQHRDGPFLPEPGGPRSKVRPPSGSSVS
jgi:enoyl-CoA hydratase/carnithine racemase